MQGDLENISNKLKKRLVLTLGVTLMLRTSRNTEAQHATAQTF
jgi:hypothetical protein